MFLTEQRWSAFAIFRNNIFHYFLRYVNQTKDEIFCNDNSTKTLYKYSHDKLEIKSYIKGEK